MIKNGCDFFCRIIHQALESIVADFFHIPSLGFLSAFYYELGGESIEKSAVFRLDFYLSFLAARARAYLQNNFIALNIHNLHKVSIYDIKSGALFKEVCEMSQRDAAAIWGVWGIIIFTILFALGSQSQYDIELLHSVPIHPWAQTAKNAIFFPVMMATFGALYFVCEAARAIACEHNFLTIFLFTWLMILAGVFFEFAFVGYLIAHFLRNNRKTPS